MPSSFFKPIVLMQQNDIPLDRQIIVMSADSLLKLLQEFFLPLLRDKETEPPKQDELIGTSDACKILGCCPRTMQRYRDLKLFPIIMNGPHKALYYRKDIEEFRRLHTRKPR